LRVFSSANAKFEKTGIIRKVNIIRTNEGRLNLYLIIITLSVFLAPVICNFSRH